MREELKKIGLDVGHHRAGMMRQTGIFMVKTGKHKVVTDRGYKFNIAANHFTADASNHRCVGDISYVRTSEGWLYLALILGLHSRCVIGCAVGSMALKLG